MYTQIVRILSNNYFMNNADALHDTIITEDDMIMHKCIVQM